MCFKRLVAASNQVRACLKLNLSSVRMALRANAENLQHMPTNLESIFRFDRCFQLLDHTLIEVNTCAAVFADEVMMVFAWFDQLVSAFAIAKSYSLYEPLANEQFK